MNRIALILAFLPVLIPGASLSRDGLQTPVRQDVTDRNGDARSLAIVEAAEALVRSFSAEQVQLSIGLTAVEVSIVIVPSPQDGPAIFSASDGNGDGVVSDEEARTFGTEVVSATRLTIDGQAFTFALTNVGIPDGTTVASGTAAITVNASAELRLADRQAHSVDFAITYEEFSHDWFVQPFLYPNLLGKISQLQIDRSDTAGKVVVRFSNR